MSDTASLAQAIAALDLTALPEGQILRPLEPLSPAEQDLLATWQTPFSQWGGFKVDSAVWLEAAPGGRHLRLAATNSGAADRALVTGDDSLREARIVAMVRPLGTALPPHADRDDCTEALAGIVFRVQTSRWYYQFGIEGRRRAVLYRRRDDEWYPLASQDVDMPDRPVRLEVTLEGDGILAVCPELEVRFHVTDTTYSAGKAGFRATGGALLFGLCVEAVPWQGRANAARRVRLAAARRQRAASVPAEVLVDTLDLEALGGMPRLCDFAVPGRFDLLLGGPRGLRALDADGRPLWNLDEPVANLVLSRQHDGGHGRLLYALAGQRKVVDRANVDGRVAAQAVQREMVVIRGSDGAVLARAEAPPEVGDMRFFDWSPTSAALEDPAGFDIVLREWRQDMGGGGCRLWAVDRNLNLLWHHQQEGAHYGHHWALAFHDVDGDGRDELLAGGYLYRGDGTVVWRHDRAGEMLAIAGAHHYDAVALGDYALDPDLDPVAFLLGGSAGVYVVEGRTGRTRAVHRIGHAQGRVLCDLRDDLPGSQVLAVTRWGNFGILALFAGDGARLWTIQPDYVGQGCAPVEWAGRNLLWTNTSQAVQALYNGHGRKVRDLTQIQQAYGEVPRNQVTVSVVRRGTDPRQFLALEGGGKLRLYAPAT